MEGSLVGCVVTVLYPYTDLSGVERRPAVVISRMNETDYLLCQVTSQPILAPAGLQLLAEHFKSGGLTHSSQVRVDKLLTAHHAIITETVGELEPSFFTQVKNAVIELIRSN